MKLFGSLKELVSAVFRKDTYEITLRPNQSTTYTAARDIQLPAKNGDAVLVSSGDIVNNDINASAAIAYSKLNLSNSIVNGDVSATAAVAYSKLNLAGSIVNADISNTAAISDTKLATISTAGKVSNSATTATSSNTASAIVARDASGNFSAGTITATLSGNATNVSGTVAIANGGTGQTTQQAALNALAGSQVSGRYLRSDGTNTSLSSIQAADVPTLNQNTTGTAANVTGIVATANGGTGVNSTATFPSTGTVATTSNKLSAFAATSSSELAGVISDETGSGSLVFGTSPTLSSPQINSSLVVQQIATPSNPSAGFNKLYTKSDGILYKLDSSGNEVAVGSGAGGSGEINTVTNPSAATDTTGWTAGTSHTVTKDTTNSPLNPVVPTGFALSSSAAVALNSQTSTSGVYDAITMPSGLQNRKLKVEFFFTTPASSSGTWAVAVYQGSTKVALSTDSGGDTILPSGVTGGKFTAYFDTTSSASYSLNLVQRTRSLSNTLYITNVIVGPGIQPQGAVVGEWTSYTPTVTGITGTTSTVGGQYRRVGSNMEIRFQFRKDATAASGSTTTTVSLPSGFTIDISRLPYQTTLVEERNSIGVSFYESATSQRYIHTLPDSTTTFRFVNTPSTSAYLNSGIVEANATMAGLVTVPIAEWAGSGTVQLAQNDVEYASNDGSAGTAANTDYTTGSVAGPGGSSFPIVTISSTTATTITRYAVQFQTPIQATDIITLEYNIPATSNQWQVLGQNAGSVCAFLSQGAVGIGVGYDQRDSTSVWVRFSNAGRTTGNTYGTASGTWANVSTWKWRVRKASAGAAVGFGIVSPGTSAGLVSAAGLPGNTTGNAIAIGYVGEKVTWATPPASQVLTTTTADWTNASISLSAGVWLITANISMRYVTGTTAGNAGNARFYITDSANTTVQNMVKSLGSTTSAAAASRAQGTLSGSFVVQLNATTIYKIRVDRLDITGTGSGDVFNESGVYSEFFAIRIA